MTFLYGFGAAFVGGLIGSILVSKFHERRKKAKSEFDVGQGVYRTMVVTAPVQKFRSSKKVGSSIMPVFFVFVLGLVFVFAVAAGLAECVSLLFNYIATDMGYHHHLGFWPAFAVLILCGILFKSSSSSRSK